MPSRPGNVGEFTIANPSKLNGYFACPIAEMAGLALDFEAKKAHA
jgi:hypothetical protein